MAEWEETSWHLVVGQPGPLLLSGPACLLLHGFNSPFVLLQKKIESDWIGRHLIAEIESSFRSFLSFRGANTNTNHQSASQIHPSRIDVAKQFTKRTDSFLRGH